MGLVRTPRLRGHGAQGDKDDSERSLFKDRATAALSQLKYVLTERTDRWSQPGNQAWQHFTASSSECLQLSAAQGLLQTHSPKTTHLFLQTSAKNRLCLR